MFFNHIRGYIAFYCVFGMWSTWKDNQHKWLLKTYSLLSISSVACSFWSAFLLRRFFDGISLSTSVASSSFFAIILTHSVVAVESILKSRAQKQLIQKFTIIDQMFSRKVNGRLSYRKEKRELFFQNFALISMVLINKIIILSYAYFFSRSLNFMYFAAYSSWIMRLRPIQVLLFVRLMQNRLKLINKQLLNVQNVSQSMAAVTITTAHISTSFDRLLDLKYIYGELYEICDLINSIFGSSLLATITQSFIDFTMNWYWLFVNFERESTNYEVPVICTSLLLPNMIIVGILSFYSTSCLKEVTFVPINDVSTRVTR